MPPIVQPVHLHAPPLHTLPEGHALQDPPVPHAAGVVPGWHAPSLVVHPAHEQTPAPLHPSPLGHDCGAPSLRQPGAASAHARNVPEEAQIFTPAAEHSGSDVQLVAHAFPKQPCPEGQASEGPQARQAPVTVQTRRAPVPSHSVAPSCGHGLVQLPAHADGFVGSQVPVVHALLRQAGQPFEPRTQTVMPLPVVEHSAVPTGSPSQSFAHDAPPESVDAAGPESTSRTCPPFPRIALHATRTRAAPIPRDNAPSHRIAQA